MSVSEGAYNIVENLKSLVSEGYSIAIFPEGARPESGLAKVMRFHKGAFHIAQELNLDVIPAYFYGLTEIMPKGSALSNGGTMYIGVGKRIPYKELENIGDLAAQARTLRKHYKEELLLIHHKIMSLTEAKRIVFDRYLYKGRDIEVHASKVLKCIEKYSECLSKIKYGQNIVIDDIAGQGELALVLSLMYPHSNIYCHLATEDTKLIFEGCCMDFAKNIHILNSMDELADPDSYKYLVCDKDMAENMDPLEAHSIIVG